MSGTVAEVVNQRTLADYLLAAFMSSLVAMVVCLPIGAAFAALWDIAFRDACFVALGPVTAATMACYLAVEDRAGHRRWLKED